MAVVETGRQRRLVIQGDSTIPDSLSRDDFGGYGTTVTLTFETDGNCDP